MFNLLMYNSDVDSTPLVSSHAVPALMPSCPNVGLMNTVNMNSNLLDNPRSSKAEKFDIVTRNLDEVLGADLLKATLEERDLVAYWGTAPTGRRE